jgi:hypothetical protein
VNGVDPSGRDSYATACAQGAVTGLAIGARGADETGVGAVGSALSGCAQGIIETAVDQITGTDAGTVGGLIKDVSDIASDLDL